MIRINLIQSPEREGEAKAKLSGPPRLHERKEFFPLAALVVCFAVVGLFYWGWNHSIAVLSRQLAAERQDAARLAAVEAQNKIYQAQLSAINQHISVIQALQKSRTGPRDFMTLLGNTAGAVNGLYLISVKKKNDRVHIHGQSDNVDAVANFIAALESVNSFSEVELRQVFEDDQSTRVSFKFDLDCFYKPPVEMAASTPPAPPSGSPRRLPGR